MPNITITGRVLEIFPVQKINEKFSKREFVIETDEQYPQTIKLECTGKSISLSDNIEINQNIEVQANLKGSKWTNRDTNNTSYFTALSVWRITNLTKPTSKPITKSFPEVKILDKMISDNVDSIFSNAIGELDDDLPF